MPCGRVVAAKKTLERIEPEIRVEVIGVVCRSGFIMELPGNWPAQPGDRADVERKRNPGGPAARKQRAQIVDRPVEDGKTP